MRQAPSSGPSLDASPRPPTGAAPGARHAHVAAAREGLLVTVGERLLAVALDTRALADPGGRREVRAALEARLGPLVTWPDGAGPGRVLGPPGTVWWSGGAWFACTSGDATRARRTVRTHAPDAMTADAWARRPVDLGLPVVPDPDLDRVRAVVADLVPGTLVRCAGGYLTRHRLRPWPLHDPVTGAARSIVVRAPEDGLPAAFRHVHAVLPRTELGWPAWQADRLAPAAAWAVAPGPARGPEQEPAHEQAHQAAHEAALTSAVAHLAGPWTGASVVRRSTVARLEAEGAAYVDPGELAVTDPAVVAHPASPLTPLDPREELAWVRGHQVAGDGPVWVPLRFVHTHADPPAAVDQPVSAYHNLVGSAAGSTRAEAIERALAHVVSHDAVARWWRRADAAAPARLAVPPGLRAAWQGADVELDLRRVPCRFSPPVVLAVVRDRRRGLLALGHAAGLTTGRVPAQTAGLSGGLTGGDVEGAARAATLEALVQLVHARDLDRPDSLVRAAAARGAGAVPGLLDHRPVRDYLDAAPLRADLGGVPGPRPAVLDPMVHLQLGLDPRLLRRVEERLDAGQDGSSPRTDEEAPGEDPRERAVWVETTPPPLRGGGRVAVRVVLPGALRLEPAAFPGPPPPVGATEAAPYPGW